MPEAEVTPAEPQIVEVEKSVLDSIVKATQDNGRQQYVIIPKTFEEAEKYADFIARSQLLPKGMGKNEVLLVIQVGLEHGLSPMQSLSGMMCVNNRVAIWGDLALGLVIRSGKMESFDEDSAAVALKQGYGRCRSKRKDSPPCRKDPSKPEIQCIDAFNQKPRSCCIEHRFSLEDAKAAGLMSKDGPWKTYPGRMLQMRPRSWTFRDLYSDVLRGLSVVEEVRDYNTPHTNAVVEETLRMPQRKSEAPQTAMDKAVETKPEEAAAPAAPDVASTESGTWTGKLDRVETQNGIVAEGKRKGQPYSLHYLHCKKAEDEKEPKKFASFSSTVAKDANDAVQKDIEVSIAFGPGKSCPTVKSIAPAIVGEPGEQG